MSSTVFVNSVTLTAATWFQDVDTVAYQYLTSVSGTNTITAVGPSGLGAYAAGLQFRFIPAVTNTAAATINITGASALGARNIFSGGAALSGSELVAGVPCTIMDDGTQFNIISSPFYKQGTWVPSLGGTATYSVQTGTYTKIGNTVLVECILAVTAIGTGSTSVISGLPFNASGQPTFSVSNLLSSATAIVSSSASGAAASAQITIRSRVAANVSEGINAIFQNGTSITVSGSYRT